MKTADRSPPTVKDWPDPVPTAAGGALLLALLSPWWPGLVPAVAALAALGGAALIVRLADIPGRLRRSRLRALRWPLTGAAGAWILLGSGLALPPVVRALPLAVATLWMARAARTAAGGPVP